MPLSRFVLALGAAVLLAALPATAQPENLLPNPNFDHDISGWSPSFPGGAEWSPLDAGGDLAGGSAFVRAPAELTTTSGIPVAEGERYALTGETRFGQVATGGGAFLFVRWHGPSCQDVLRQDTIGRLVGQPGDGWNALASAFVAPSGAACATVGVRVATVRPGLLEARFDRLRFGAEEANCAHGPFALCLGERYLVEARWRTADRSGPGVAVPLTLDTGAFYFFDSQNFELMVKVLNGCPLNGHVWIFAAGLTDVEVQLVVTDSATLAQRVYQRPRGTAFQPIQDVLGFPCS